MKTSKVYYKKCHHWYSCIYIGTPLWEGIGSFPEEMCTPCIHGVGFVGMLAGYGLAEAFASVIMLLKETIES